MPSRSIVAIIDDDAQVRESLSLLLSTAQIQALSYVSAEAFLNDVDLKEVAAILLDVRLPGLSGLELLDKIAKSDGNVMVIMITGHGDVAMAVSAMKSGAYHFVEKPFDPEALLLLVGEALEHANTLAGRHIEERAALERYRLLTPREREVLDLLVEGLPTKAIAFQLDISIRTAEHHRAAVMKKMEVRTLSHLVRLVLQLRSEGSPPPS
jgi:FixJ family two-component response regulator